MHVTTYTPMYLAYRRLLPCLLTGCLLLLSACGGSSSTPPPVPPPPQPPPPAPQLQTWSNTINGLQVTMVGSDPTVPGAGTAQIPVVIIPVRIDFASEAMSLSPDSPACGDTVSALDRLSNSPVFQSTNWSAGSGFTGNTQFADAYQRANFSKYVASVSPDYHVLLAPITVLPTATVEAPPGHSLDPNPSCPGDMVGGVPIAFMESTVESLIAANHIQPDTLPIFVTYNVKFLLQDGGVYIGFHNTDGRQTFIVASYTDPNLQPLPGFSFLISDVSILTHEIGEWLDDPFLSNLISPPWGQIGLEFGCDSHIEVGDPLILNALLPVATPSFGYHVQELAYFSWFARDVTSIAANGRYSSVGSLTAPAPPCM